MNAYVTSSAIRRCWERQGLTQAELAERIGDSLIGCCGLTLPPLEAEDADDAHSALIEPVEDEHFITIRHPMTKQHYISFLAFITTDRVQLVKLYPEGNAETRLQLRGTGILYWYCNHHGLYEKRIKRTR